MRIHAQLDSRTFDAAIKEILKDARKIPAEVANQRALNVAGRAYKDTPPKSPPAARREVKRYMDTQLAQKVKQAKSGKRKGQFRKSGRARDQLMRKHLIAQAKNKAAGRKGLYGEDMRDYSGFVSRRSQVSQGYLKALFMPIIRGLNRVCKFKVPFSVTNREVALWPGSGGSAVVLPAKDGETASTILATRVSVDSSQGGKVQALQIRILSNAMAAEAKEILRHLSSKLEASFRKASRITFANRRK